MARNTHRRNYTRIPIGEITQEIFDRAVLNLYSFDVVGITEEFDRSLEILKATYFWCIDNYSALNITPDRPRQNEIDPEIIKSDPNEKPLGYEIV